MKRRRGVHIAPKCPYCKEPYLQKARLFTEDGLFEIYRHEGSFCSPAVFTRRGGVIVERGVFFEMIQCVF
jgi:hypothetical protein